MTARSTKLTIPTGYESQQKAIERRRKMADAMMEAGMSPPAGMRSWFQVLGSLGQTGAGAYLNRKTDKVETELDDTIRKDYSARIQAFTDKARKLDPASPTYRQDLLDLHTEAAADPMLEGVAKPWVDAAAAQLKESGEHMMFGDQYRSKGGIKEGAFAPPKPNDPIIRRPDGSWGINELSTIAALSRQPNVDIDPNAIKQLGAMNYPDPSRGPAPVQPPVLPPTQAPPMPGGGSIPFGDPTKPPSAGGRPPDDVDVDGNPIWFVNGQYYDNPEGR